MKSWVTRKQTDDALVLAARHRGFNMTGVDDFHAQYIAALHTYLHARDEDSLTVGYELDAGPWKKKSACSASSSSTQGRSSRSPKTPNRRPRRTRISVQTLAPLDVATRGFLDGTKRYAEQRARAEDLADRDTFRTALVNSLQEGFFVADHDGAVIEMNNASSSCSAIQRGFTVPMALPVVGGRKTGVKISRWFAARSAEYETRSHLDGPPRVGDGEHQCGLAEVAADRRICRHGA